ncbi:MAG: hypothetical protein U0169_11855 [Polyangiaceae bacterium]
MSVASLTSSRSFRAAALFTLSALAVTTAGCSAAEGDLDSDLDVGASTDAITDVDHSAVKRQSIGNCWIYATASWAESLNKAATQKEANLSESYWTYWHWFEQIANGGFASEISTGGSYGVSVGLIQRYGLMNEVDFIPSEATAEMSGRQASALSAINTSLKSGALKDRAARRNRATVRRELDKAWGLDAKVVADLDSVFGTTVSRTLDRGTGAMPTGSKVLRAKDFPARVKETSTGAFKTVTLQDAVGTRTGVFGSPSPYAWKTVRYPFDARGRRDFLKRVQRAAHDNQPVILSWFVDFNALDTNGRFMAPPASPGRQGGHMTVLEDYQIDNVPGFGTLKAGQLETRPEALSAALDDSARIDFLRVKNSWGSSRADRQFVIPGYHDLYMRYLNGPVAQCEERADGTTDTENCSDETPLWDATLPAGY